MVTIFNPDLCRKDSRQNLMFSATFSNEVKKIAANFMNEYYFVSTNKDYSTNDNIEQTIIQTSSFDDKITNLHRTLQKISGSVISNYF
jgi:superfamily II DNA/RNA helicase